MYGSDFLSRERGPQDLQATPVYLFPRGRGAPDEWEMRHDMSMLDLGSV